MASLSPATSLATYQTSHASSSKTRPHVRLSNVRNSREQLAVATVQGDGIWTYDLQTLRPTTSFTVPPSTVFAGPAVSFSPWISQSSREKEKQRAIDGDEDTSDDVSSKERITAVVITRGEGIKNSEEGRTLWWWRGEEGDKQVIKLDGPSIQHLIHLERQSGLLAVQSFSDLQYIDINLSAARITSSLSSSKDQVVLAADFLNIKSDWCLIMIDSKGRIVSGKLDFQTCTLEVLHEGSLTTGEVDLVRAEIDADGGLTAISDKDEIIAVEYKDLRSPCSHPLPVLASPLTSPILPLPYHSKPVALLPSLGTSTLALAITSPDAPAVLTSVPIILGDASTSSIVDIRVLSRPSPFSWIVGFVITHKHAQGDSGRSIVYTTEVTLPEKGIGLNLLLGSQARSSLYFKSSATRENDASGMDVISRIEAALTHSEDAEGAKAEKAESIWTSEGKGLNLSESAVRKLVGVIFAAALPGSAANGGESISSATGPRRTGPYAQRIIADLLNRRLLNDSMLPGGLLANGLLPCGDWDLIPRAIELLPTISSASVISCLIATLHPSSSSTTRPPFDTLYAQILRLPPPPPTWRVDMRRLVPVEDATVFLDTLSTWAIEHVSAQSNLSTWDAPSDSVSSLPPLPAVLNHASLLLDSHLALFLSHSPSHASLETLQETIAPLLEAQNDYRALRAPIEALLTLSDRAQRDKDESAARRDAQRPIDRKRGTRGGMKSGYAELRTEVIGQWRVEDFAF